MQNIIKRFFWIIILFCICCFIFIKANGNLFDTQNIWDEIQTIVVGGTVVIALWDFQEKIKGDKLAYAVKLAEDFDGDCIRAARRITRKLDDKELTPETICNFLMGKEIDEEIEKKIMQLSINDNRLEVREQLRESVIWMFNYYQRLYMCLKYGQIEKKYILHLLSSVYLSQYERFKPWIEELKNTDNNLFKKFAINGK